tara:strand:- start:3064 stop:4245 length:1182 start_codon:yes stop_codon:yes gene_type:complete
MFLESVKKLELRFNLFILLNCVSSKNKIIDTLLLISSIVVSCIFSSFYIFSMSFFFLIVKYFFDLNKKINDKLFPFFIEKKNPNTKYKKIFGYLAKRKLIKNKTGIAPFLHLYQLSTNNLDNNKIIFTLLNRYKNKENKKVLPSDITYNFKYDIITLEYMNSKELKLGYAKKTLDSLKKQEKSKLKYKNKIKRELLSNPMINRKQIFNFDFVKKNKIRNSIFKLEKEEIIKHLSVVFSFMILILSLTVNLGLIWLYPFITVLIYFVSDKINRELYESIDQRKLRFFNENTGKKLSEYGIDIEKYDISQNSVLTMSEEKVNFYLELKEEFHNEKIKIEKIFIYDDMTKFNFKLLNDNKLVNKEEYIQILKSEGKTEKAILQEEHMNMYDLFYSI